MTITNVPLLTLALHTVLRATAAAGPTRQSRLVPGLRVFLWEAQGRRCFDCREAIANPLAAGSDLCHIIGRCEGRGYMPGNIALGCRECNAEHNGYGSFIPFSEIERLGMVIPAVWPTAQELIALGLEFKATLSEREVMRVARRDFDAV